jgi:H2-forming N5,N10-methylenetetrahydromethanopterin dehydrogenase-like enzyme
VQVLQRPAGEQVCAWPNYINDVHDQVRAPVIVCSTTSSSGERLRYKLETGLRDPDGDRAKKASTDPS